ncbi:MAG: hypothetical protein KF742_02460 [Cryobacterium sp.]|nr:hypothetical protein [Cryobacterium sp.]
MRSTSTVAPSATTVAPRRGVRVLTLHDALWRVTRTDGEVLGYVESFEEPRGLRFRAKRMIPLNKRFIIRGEFWSFDDAVDCLRFG